MAKNLTIAKLWLFLLVHRREVLFDLQPNKNKGENKMQENELKYYEKTKNWDFSYIKRKTEKLTNWDFYEKIKENTTINHYV